MFVSFKVLFFSFLLLLLSGCGKDISVDKDKPELPLTLSAYIEKNIKFNKPHAFAVIKDDLGVLYQEKDQYLFHRKGVTTIIASKQKPAGHFWLHFDGLRIYALWWRKFNADNKGKQLFISVSNDLGKSFSPPKVINNDYGVLPQISIASNKNDVIVSYFDERNGKYKVYANISSDGGETWLQNDILIDQASIEEGMDKKQKLSISMTPNTVAVNKKIVVVWLQKDRQNPGFSLKSRSFDLINRSWSEIKSIYSNLDLPGAEYQVYESDKNVIVLVDVKGEGLLSFISGNAGTTWKALGSNYSNLATTEKPGVSFLGLATDKHDKKAYVVTTREDPAKKPSIDLTVISLSDKKYLGDPQEIDRGKDHSLTRSNNPKIGSFADGTIVVAWDDYRHIQSTVYVDIKKSGADKWLEKPRPLTAPGYYNVNLESLLLGNTKGWIITKRKILNASQTKLVDEFYVQEIKNNKDGNVVISNLPGKSKVMSKTDLKKRLEKRVKEFWALRKKGDLKAAWQYFDPLYRLKFGENNWLKTQGKLNFGEFRYNGVELQENGLFGLSKGEVKVGINLQSATEGVLEASPPVFKNADSKWGWFYDDWYLMPRVFYMKVYDY